MILELRRNWVENMLPPRPSSLLLIKKWQTNTHAYSRQEMELREITQFIECFENGRSLQQ